MCPISLGSYSEGAQGSAEQGGVEKNRVTKEGVEGRRSTEPQKVVELYNKVFRAANKTGIYYFATREKEGKHNSQQGERKRTPCLMTLPILSMAIASGYFQVLFSSSVIFSASYTYFTTHENWKRTIRHSHTARNSTNEATILKAQGLEKYQLRIKIRKRKKICKEVNSLMWYSRERQNILLGNSVVSQCETSGNSFLQYFQQSESLSSIFLTKWDTCKTLFCNTSQTLKNESHRHEDKWLAMDTHAELAHEHLRILHSPLANVH